MRLCYNHVMSLASPEAKPWWAYNDIATSPHFTDLGAECGHSRDLHDSDGKCCVNAKDLAGGGFEGLDENGKAVWTDSDHFLRREQCFCPGETIYYKCGFVGKWDSLNETPFRDPHAKLDEQGRYRWYIS